MYNFLFKFVLVGNKNVGKTTLLKKYIQSSTSPTIGVDFFCSSIIYNNKTVKLHIWDTSGNFNFLNIIRSYLKNSIGAIIVFSYHDINSFNDIDFWMQQLNADNVNYKKICLIGTYDNGPVVVNRDLIENKCRQYGLDFFDAGGDFHIELCFLKMVGDIMRDYRERPYVFNNLDGFKDNAPVRVTTDYINFENKNWEEDDAGQYLCCKKNCNIL